MHQETSVIKKKKRNLLLLDERWQYILHGEQWRI